VNFVPVTFTVRDQEEVQNRLAQKQVVQVEPVKVMAPISALDKALADRDSCADILTVIETEIAGNALIPLLEPAADHLFALLKAAQAEIFEIHKRIQVIISPGDMTAHVAELSRLLSKSNLLLNGLTGIKNRFVPTNPIPTSTGASSHFEIRLPKLELPTFDGNLQTWISFRDLFTNAVHNKTNISKGEKLTYLKSLLKGEAARIIQTLVVTDANYDIAWSKLTDRYQNERELVFSIFDRFIAQPNVNSNCSSSLRNLIDTTLECTRSLEVFGIKLETGLDAFILFSAFRKLDSTSKQLWEQQLMDTKVPKLQALIDFMEQRARALAASGSISKSTHQSGRQDFRFFRPQGSQPRNMVHHSSQGNCKVCNVSSHPLFKCSKFHGLTTQDRIESVKRSNVCFNCLTEGHSASHCSSSKSCRSCGGKHHTLLHRQQFTDNKSTVSSQVAHCSIIQGNSTTSREVQNTCHAAQKSQADQGCDSVLATIVVQAKDAFGDHHKFRVLYDPGSNTNYVTMACIRRLKLKTSKCVAPSTGLGGVPVAMSNESVTVTVSPHSDITFSLDMKSCVVPKITCNLPQSSVEASKWTHLQGLELADPLWFKSGPIDLLMGSEFAFAILEAGKKQGPVGSPIAINSTFGWLIGGGSKDFHGQQCHSFVSQLNQSCIHDGCLDKSIRRFWEVEELPEVKFMTKEEQKCEEHFAATHKRDEEGRFIVSVPWKSTRPVISDSHIVAKRRFLSLERRFERALVQGSEVQEVVVSPSQEASPPNFQLHVNSELVITPSQGMSNPTRQINTTHTKSNSTATQHHVEEYIKFMREYLSLGHMEEVPQGEVLHPTVPVNYIPHHFVLKQDSTTTKLRVVFDGSAKTPSGKSLNETMIIGPTLQDTLMAIISRFRLYPIAITADIAKMYRQVKLEKEDADMHRIFWRESPKEPLKVFRLLTVTYGTSSAPYLAVKALIQGSLEHQSNAPLGSKAIQNSVYVDDLMHSCQTEEEATQTIQESIQIASGMGMEFRKWSSNSDKVLLSIPDICQESQQYMFIGEEDTVRALGILWNRKLDSFQFKFSMPISGDGFYTKRRVLSEMSQIFDPLGWLSPAIIRAKLFLQMLWSLQSGWDDVLPPQIQQQWEDYKLDMKRIESLSIPRCMIHANPICINLNGFSDASERAYSAVVYLCAYYQNCPPRISLITSKTRVAPLKTVSLPRLELNGAKLLAELIHSVKKMLKLPINEVYAWSDSTITLAWIKSEPSRYQTFVANRISKIQELVKSESWGHVKGEENPADLPSRGVSVDMLGDIWWQGPDWLRLQSIRRPEDVSFAHPVILAEEKKVLVTFHSIKRDYSLLERFSSLNKLLRVTSWIFRFSKLAREKKESKVNSKLHKQVTPLSPEELNHSLQVWLLLIQECYFKEEISALQSHHALSRKSKILSLHPFLDSVGVLRVGGRLKNANLTYDMRNPILLPRRSYLTDLIIRDAHLQNLHAGPQLLQATLNQRFWIIRCRDAVRFHVKKCVTCTRHAAKTQSQMMGDLPSYRVTQARPFQRCGIDYAGPFMLKSMVTRSKVTLKGYLAIFICLVTRAIHIELVSGLSTSAFQAALKRFVSRRGRPTDIYSDCGTNFVGAARELKEWIEMVKSEDFNQVIANQMSIQGVTWHFNPPSAPHFGGIWEAGVKSIKYHLYRIMGSHRLNYEEMTTLCTQIEACLNSRPITATSSDPNDFTALTPGHFLIGSSLNAIPEPNLLDLKVNRLDRWQFLQSLNQHFWKRWSSEFLTRLQQRPKWMQVNKNINVGDLVIIKDDRYPPQEWNLGRVMHLYPGADDIVRVVTVRTATGELKRPIVKLCLLPIHDHDDSTDDSLNIV
jgi:hypothetical protein